MTQAIISIEPIETLILLIRGKRVIIDADLARLYGVTTKALNQAIKRNAGRFPTDFLLRLSEDEKNELVTKCDRFKNLKHSSTLPYAFTDYGSIMAANVLNSARAAEVSVYVVRAFVALRGMVRSHGALEEKLNELECRIATHDGAIRSLFDAIRKLLEQPRTPRKKIGFIIEK